MAGKDHYYARGIEMKILNPSATVSINGLAMKKRSNGERVFNLAAGDPVLDNHPKIIQRAVGHAEKGQCPYPPVEGLPELRSLTADWVNASCGTYYQKENVMATCGGKFALFSLIYSLLEEGEEVLIPAPYWVSYPDIVKIAGGKPNIVNASPGNGWKITAKDLHLHATVRSKILIFNNACNPTGVLYEREEISAILTAAKRLGLIVISDEVYSGLVYDGSYISCGSFPEHKERIIIVQSCSKNFAMAGWRVGFVLGSESIIRRLSVLQSQSTTGTSVSSQWAAVGALEHADEVNRYVRERMKQRRDLFVQTYNSIFPIPIESVPSALYAFVPLTSMGINDASDSAAFCEQIIAADNIAMVPGSAFGAEGYVRFAFSETEEEIVQALHALHQSISRKLSRGRE